MMLSGSMSGCRATSQSKSGNTWACRATMYTATSLLVPLALVSILTSLAYAGDRNCWRTLAPAGWIAAVVLLVSMSSGMLVVLALSYCIVW